MSNHRPVYKHLASLLSALSNCEKANLAEMATRHESAIRDLVKNFMPSGSGIDCGTKLVLEKSNSERLVFAFSFHHMNDCGMYDGWTEHKAIVTPSLAFGYNLKITGRDRNQIKEYFAEVFDFALNTQVYMDSEGKWHEAKQG